MLVAGLVAVAALLLLPGLLVGPSLDAAVFAHVSGRLLDGATLYVDTWDHKPPGIYVVEAVARLAFGWLGAWPAAWLLSVAATAALGWGVVAVLVGVGVTRRAAVVAGALGMVAAAQYLLSLGGGLSEPIATAFAVGALVAVIAEASPTRRRRLAGIGALLAGACLISLQLAPAALAVGGLAAARSPATRRLPALGWMLVGAAAPLFVVLVWLGANGAIAAAWDAVVTYSAAYAAANAAVGGALSGPVVAWTLFALLALIVPAAMGALAAMRPGSPHRPMAIACGVWIGLALAVFVVQGRFIAHYAIPLTVPLGLLAGIGLADLAVPTRRRLPAAMLLGALATSVLAGTVAGGMELAPVAASAERVRVVVARLRQEFPRGMPPTLLVWGNQPRLYDATGMTPATRYSYIYPLTTPGYSSTDQVEVIRHAFATHAPVLVIDAGSDAPGSPGFLPLLIPRPVLTDGRDLDTLRALRIFVEREYTLIDTVAGWPIYYRHNVLRPL